MSSHSILQAIFMTQGSNAGIFHCRQLLSCLSHQTLVSRLRVPGCVGTGIAEMSYHMPEIRGGGQEELPRIQGQWRQKETPHVRGQWQRPGGAIPGPRSGAAWRSHLAPEARGGDPEEPPQPEASVDSWEDPPMPEARASCREEQPEERWLRRHRRA